MSDSRPAPASVDDHARRAQESLDPAVWAHFASGAQPDRNRLAWEAIELLPRVLRRIESVRLDTEILGRRWPSPVLVAPIALQKLAHADGELAMALAASTQGCGMVVSSFASLPLEGIAQAVREDAGRGPLWFQLYVQPDRGLTEALVQRAEAAGYEAIVLTVDASVRAQRASVRLPAGVTYANLPAPPARDASLEELLAAAPDWDDVAWLGARTRLPIVIKGVLHPADARECARAGAAAVIVSNHGGRALEGAAAVPWALGSILDAVGTELPVLVDGGLHRGSDILKALALGAQGVLVGRAALWGLASGGAAGAAHVLRLLLDELRLALAQCGASTPAELDGSLLFPPRT